MFQTKKLLQKVRKAEGDYVKSTMNQCGKRKSILGEVGCRLEPKRILVFLARPV